MTLDSGIAKTGVIVCRHVAVEGAPILRAVRGEPVDEADSGWQVLCDSGKDERVEDAQIWSVAQVIERERSLTQFMGCKIGTEVVRTGVSSPWTVRP